MVKRQWNNQNGFALPLVLIIFSISFLLVTSVFIFTHSQMKQEVDYGKDMESIHFAEAGLHYALEYLNNSDPDKGLEDIQGYVDDDGLLIEGFIYKVDENGLITSDMLDRDNGKYVLKLSTDGAAYTVSSTGWPATDGENNKRTVEANINKKRFTDYLYFFNSNYQIPDGADINGPYHSNGDLSVEGSATFLGAVTYVTGEFVIDDVLHDFLDGPPRKISSIEFPLSLLEDLETAADIVYSGDTRIFFWDSSMRVSQEEPPGEEEEEEEEDDSVWVTEFVPLPVNGVIYVDGDVYISGEIDEIIKGLTIAASGSIIISPVDPIDDIPVDEKVPVPWIRCKDQESILGLIAGIQVRTMTVWYNGDPIPVGPDGIRIEAAIIALGGGFRNEGVLTFTGSITQNLNEIVDPGFTETYQHSSLIPPHFIEPQNTRYEIISWIETNEHISFP